MTLRAILIGLLLGLAIASLGYLNDWVLDQAYVASDLLPISVYGLLILGLLIANPLLRAIRTRQFSGREWCVIVALMLVACVVPGPGMMWTFSQTLALPHRHESITPGWQTKRVLEYAPGVAATVPALGPCHRKALDTIWRREIIRDQRPTAVVGRITWEIPVEMRIASCPL